MGDLFAVLDEMNESAHRAVASGGPYDQPEGRLELAMFTRAINALKASRGLLQNQHWEHATTIVRQIYELSLNLEWLQAQPDRQATILRYAKFAVLQKVRARIADADYGRSTGRHINEEHIAALDTLLRDQFAEFIAKVKEDGSITWRTSWSGKNTRELAVASEHGLRLPQYLVLYKGDWSEQVHGSPVVFLDGLFPVAGEDWLADTVESDDIKTIETAMMLVTLFVEFWSMMNIVAPPDSRVAASWGRRASAVAREYDPERWRRSQVPTSGVAASPDGTHGGPTHDV